MSQPLTMPKNRYLQKIDFMNYLIAHDLDKPETMLIIQKESPCIIGKLIKFSDESRMEDFIAQKKANGGFIGAQIQGYTVLVVPSGELPINARRTHIGQVQSILSEMAIFVLEQVIPNSGKREFKYNKIG